MRPGWNLFAGATVLRAKTPDGKAHNPDMPTRSIKLFTTYQMPGDLNKWTLGGGRRWQNKTWNEAKKGANVYLVKQRAYAVGNVMASYDLNDSWATQLNVNNVFDKTYYTQPASEITYGGPRNAMLTLVSKF